ncbi:MAG: hypothetical protein DMG32_21410, partial [Acidobacteria bacterium]
ASQLRLRFQRGLMQGNFDLACAANTTRTHRPGWWLDSILNVLVEPFKLCILGSQLLVFGFLSLSQKKFAQNCQKPFHMPLLRAKVEIWAPAFKNVFGKSPSRSG